MSKVFPDKEVWFAAGSQHLYGREALQLVESNAQKISAALDSDPTLPVRLFFRGTLATPDQITSFCREASASASCIGVVCWMHTFSPAKMWISGLSALKKPLCHLHTQLGRDIPWMDIDMDFMNLHQSAHGDREFGHICSRLRLPRTVVVGHWEDVAVRQRMAVWMRAAIGLDEMRSLRVVRFGDNMREVAVTEGDKVDAQTVFGFSVNTHGVGDLVHVINKVSDKDVDELCAEYEVCYRVADALRRDGQRHYSLRTAARMELGLRAFLTMGGYGAFTDTFEDLHGLDQLPGIAVQRLMADGYGFGAEGDWKHAALVRVMKKMAAGEDRGTSFMEDYTYHLKPGSMSCLGAHMLEICPTIAAERPSCEIHPLGIGGKSDPVRLIFNGKEGPAINASIVDLGNRFRLLVAELEAITPPQPMPRLPVARVLWKVRPDFQTGVAAWIRAGGAHHTGFSYSLTTQHFEDLADMLGLELVTIDSQTTLGELRDKLRWNELAYGLRLSLP